MVRADDPLLRQADRLLMMADLFHHFLAGGAVAEYTNASTSQCLDPVARDWARPLLARFGIPTGILPAIVEPGTVLGPRARRTWRRRPACATPAWWRRARTTRPPPSSVRRSPARRPPS